MLLNVNLRYTLNWHLEFQNFCLSRPTFEFTVDLSKQVASRRAKDLATELMNKTHNALIKNVLRKISNFKPIDISKIVSVSSFKTALKNLS